MRPERALRPARAAQVPAPAGGVVVEGDGRARRLAEPVAAEVGDDQVDVAQAGGVGAEGPPVGEGLGQDGPGLPRGERLTGGSWGGRGGEERGGIAQEAGQGE